MRDHINDIPLEQVPIYEDRELIFDGSDRDSYIVIGPDTAADQITALLADADSAPPPSSAAQARRPQSGRRNETLDRRVSLPIRSSARRAFGGTIAPAIEIDIVRFVSSRVVSDGRPSSGTGRARRPAGPGE